MFEHFSHDLRDLDFKKFLSNGFLIQSPETNKVWLGVISQNDLGVAQCKLNFLNFFKTKNTEYSCNHIFCLEKEDIIDFFAEKFSQKTQLRYLEDNKSDYVKDVERILNAIHLGEIKKLVPVSRAVYDMNAIHPISRLSEFDKLNGSLYGVWENGKGMLGVTPEPLFVLNDAMLSTVALAGTINTNQENYEDHLLENSKELEEHKYVIDDIKDKLASFTNDHETSKTYVFNYGPIAHLKTNMTFKNIYASSTDLMAALSPTAALGGYPAHKEDRTFGGILCLETPQERFALVCIRNIAWNGKKAYIDSGGGIVLDSQVEKEYQEIKAKRLAIEEVFK